MGSKQIAIMFSALTPGFAPASQDSYDAILPMQRAASRALESDVDACVIIEKWLEFSAVYAADTVDIYGVIPPILRAEICAEARRNSAVMGAAPPYHVKLNLYESHEGRWVRTGNYSLLSP